MTRQENLLHKTTRLAKPHQQEKYCLTSADDPLFDYHKAIASNDLDTVKQLLPTCDNERAMDVAAMHNSIEILMYLHKFSTKGCTTRSMDYAAAFGHFECMRFLHQFRTEGCSRQALLYAACKGHLECVLYLWRNQPRPNWFDLEQAICFAKDNKHHHVVKALNAFVDHTNGGWKRFTTSIQKKLLLV
ncbi:hypothetical protein THRCLA_04839 [Thraustotheca clavata]|uniref:Uncharacterized protein n=1 Tax=Thraustotheca clavata TaxID=74557 RepID=A0A1V9ZY06_9STRA|nr:hypothetical protein THRCLA_04839 [Thraustotheca clavata]